MGRRQSASRRRRDLRRRGAGGGGRARRSLRAKGGGKLGVRHGGAAGVKERMGGVCGGLWRDMEALKGSSSGVV